MRNELTKLSSGHQYMNVIQDSQRKYAAWIGGSMFASLSTFQQVSMGRFSVGHCAALSFVACVGMPSDMAHVLCTD